MSSAQVRSGVCREGVKGPMCGLVDLLGDAHEHACWRVFAVQVGCSGSSEHSERKALSGWPAALFLVGPNLGGGASVGLFHGVLPVGVNPEGEVGECLVKRGAWSCSNTTGFSTYPGNRGAGGREWPSAGRRHHGQPEHMKNLEGRALRGGHHHSSPAPPPPY